MTNLLDVIEVVCARGFLRAVSRLCLTSKMVAAEAPSGTGRQIYEAAKTGDEGKLTVYLAYWRGNRDCPEVFNWSPIPLGKAVKVKNDELVHAQFQDSPLQQAVLHDRLECVQLLVSCAPGVDVNKGSHATPLHFACRRGSMPIIRALLSAPTIDVNLIDTTFHSPLQLAVLGAHTEVVRLLVSIKSIKLNAAYRGQKTALGLAANLQLEEIVAILTEATEKRRAIDAVRKQVFEAAREGAMDKLRPLVEQWKGNMEVLNYRDIDAGTDTPILAAVTKGHVNVIKLLLSAAPIDPNHLDEDGQSLLIEAAFRGRVNVVRFLLTVEGIDINAGASRGGIKLTPLYFTSVFFQHMSEDEWSWKEECAAILLAAGAY